MFFAVNYPEKRLSRLVPKKDMRPTMFFRRFSDAPGERSLQGEGFGSQERVELFKLGSRLRGSVRAISHLNNYWKSVNRNGCESILFGAGWRLS